MQPWARELLDVWKSNIPRLVRTFQEKIATNAELALNYSDSDLEQFTHGLYAMMEEELDGRDRDAYLTYLQSVIPALVMQGESPVRLARALTFDAIVVQMVIVPLMSDQHRVAAADYLMNWWANYNADVIRVALDALKDAS
nr:hypothetical protein [Myxococcales bacterium]